jgi:rod shape-determining protein MreB
MSPSRAGLGIDLGTESLLISRPGAGIILHTSSCAAVDQGSGRLLAVGEEARNLEGDGVPLVWLVRDGVIEDASLTRQALARVISRGGARLTKPRVAISVSCRASAIARRALRDAALAAGASAVELVESPIAGALGAGLPAMGPEGLLVIDIGAGVVDIAVISMARAVASEAIAQAGRAWRDAIADYLREQAGVTVTPDDAEQVKRAVGAAAPVDAELSMVVTGQVASGARRRVRVGPEEVHRALAEPLRALVTSVRRVLEQASPQLAGDVTQSGALLVGGGAQLRRLDDYLTTLLGIPVRVADSPTEAVALGLARAIDRAWALA